MSASPSTSAAVMPVDALPAAKLRGAERAVALIPEHRDRTADPVEIGVGRSQVDVAVLVEVDRDDLPGSAREREQETVVLERGGVGARAPQVEEDAQPGVEDVLRGDCIWTAVAVHVGSRQVEREPAVLRRAGREGPPGSLEPRLRGSGRHCGNGEQGEQGGDHGNRRW
jgi:hypothetical protein